MRLDYPEKCNLYYALQREKSSINNVHDANNRLAAKRMRLLSVTAAQPPTPHYTDPTLSIQNFFLVAEPGVGNVNSKPTYANGLISVNSSPLQSVQTSCLTRDLNRNNAVTLVSVPTSSLCEDELTKPQAVNLLQCTEANTSPLAKVLHTHIMSGGNTHAETTPKQNALSSGFEQIEE
uniref:Envelope glycoprotein n=1 Tax=Lygus hesperus TaxID=30085 RepID=A0A0A9WR53_LYGHE